MQYCSLQHSTLLSPPDTSTTGHRFYFGSASSFFLELLLRSSPVAYWTLADPAVAGGAHLSVSYLFAFSCCSWGSRVEVELINMVLFVLGVKHLDSWT